MLKIHVEDAGAYTICRPAGVLDAATVGEFRATIATLVGERDLIFDLSSVEFIDSAGAGAAIGATRLARKAGGRVAVACRRPAQLRFLRGIGFDRVIPIRESVESAAAALRRAPTELDVVVFVESDREAAAIRVLGDINRLVTELGYEPPSEPDPAHRP